MSEHPPSPDQPSPEFPAQSGSAWMTWFLTGGFLLLLALWIGGRPALRQWRSWQAAPEVSAAISHMRDGDMAEAARRLEAANRIAPVDPAVLRAIADFQIRTQARPAEVVQTLKRLTSGGNADAEDLLKLARAELQQGSIEAARNTLACLPESVRASAEAIELEGRYEEAETRLRAALTSATGDPKAAFKLALLDFKQPHPIIHARGRSSLWIIARAGNDNAVMAMQILAADALLTPGEADQLVALAQAHPAPGSARYAALGAQLRLRPQQRAAILERETTRAVSGDNQQRLEFAQWLSTLAEHERLLQFLPPETLVKSNNLPAGLLQLKLEALAQTHRWNDLRLLLTPEVEKVIGLVFSNLWQARLAARQPDNAEKIQQHLTRAFDAANRAQNLPAILQTVETAVSLGVTDLAASCYHELAERLDSPQARLAMLEKALALHAGRRDTAAMLRVARAIAAIAPENEPAVFRADYLALLAGEALELIAAKSGISVAAGPEAAAHHLLLQALAAYRLHQPTQEHAALKGLKHFAWPPGQRAVLAAMLAVGGDAAEAFQIAENIPAMLLLPEEARLLKLAR